MAKRRGPKTVDYVYLAEGIALSPDAAPSERRVRLDGTFSVPYVTAYTAAWQHLLPRTRELAIPILYLQRHTFELILKEVLMLLLNIREEMQLRSEVFGVPITSELSDQADWDSDWILANDEHKLGPLFRCLNKNLHLLELPPLHEDFHTAKALLHSVENGNETRLRYATLRGKTTGRSVRSFDEGPENSPKIAPMEKLVDVLTRIVLVHFRLADASFRGESPSFLETVVEKGEANYYEVADELQTLERATRRGEVVWDATREPPLDLSADRDLSTASAMNSLCKEYLVADYGGRSLAVFVLVDSSGVRDEFLLAHQLGDGRLTRVLSTDTYQSNLPSAVVASARRDRTVS